MNNLSLNKTTLKQLYGKGLSMSEIAQIQQCSVHKIVYWMNKYRIDRRSRSEALYRRLNPFGDPFQIKNNLTQKDLFLKGLGLGIYWGEGNKVSPYVISVTNTDPFMLQSFILFLKVICSVKSEKIGYSIVCFNDSDVDEVSAYWSHELQVPVEKFGKIVQVRQQGKGTYKKKSKFGVCAVTVCNIKLKQWLMNELAIVNA